MHRVPRQVFSKRLFDLCRVEIQRQGPSTAVQNIQHMSIGSQTLMYSDKMAYTFEKLLGGDVAFPV